MVGTGVAAKHLKRRPTVLKNNCAQNKSFVQHCVVFAVIQENESNEQQNVQYTLCNHLMLKVSFCFLFFLLF